MTTVLEQSKGREDWCWEQWSRQIEDKYQRTLSPSWPLTHYYQSFTVQWNPSPTLNPRTLQLHCWYIGTTPRSLSLALYTIKDSSALANTALKSAFDLPSAMLTDLKTHISLTNFSLECSVVAKVKIWETWKKKYLISPVLVSWRPKYLFSLGKLLSFAKMVKVHNENSPCLYLYQSIAHRQWLKKAQSRRPL